MLTLVESSVPHPRDVGWLVRDAQDVHELTESRLVDRWLRRVVENDDLVDLNADGIHGLDQ
jgi:hypothetical protein